jgi:hypothetical protein
MVFFEEVVWATNFLKIAHFKDNFFSSILFVDEKKNSRYGLNLGLLGCSEDSNHYINLFLLK